MSPEEKRILKGRIRQYEELENKISYLKDRLQDVEYAKQYLIESKQTKGTVETPTIEIRVPYRGNHKYYRPVGFDIYEEAMNLLVKEIVCLKFKIQRIKEQIRDL